MRTMELCVYAGISPRQAQWWSEHRILQHETNGNSRVFDPLEARRALVYARLRRKGLTLSVIRGLRLKEITGKYLATDGRKALQTDDCAALVEWISGRAGGVVVVSTEKDS